jgi:hypothetical protein
VSADLVGMVKLVHQVTGFLVRLSPQQLSGLADGRLSLAVNAAAEPPETPPGKRPEAGASGADFAEIAEALRGQETIDDGLAYLDGVKVGGKKLAKADLLAVGKELQLTLPASSTVANAKRKLLEHAIGARRKYAGLAP